MLIVRRYLTQDPDLETYWMNTSKDTIEAVTVAGMTSGDYRSSAPGGSAKGPSSRLTVARVSYFIIAT